MTRDVKLAFLLGALALHACSGDEETTGAPSGGSSSGGSTSASSASSSSSGATPTPVGEGPPPGNPDGTCAVPAEAAAENVSTPTTVVGKGTPESCTADAFVAAVANGGVVTFDCGASPTTITLTKSAVVRNDKPGVVIDGGGKITLSGGGTTRILTMNACDPANGGYASGVPGDCNEQVTPKLTVQNLTFADGHVELGNVEGSGGGAIWARGGRTKIVNSRFFHDTCDESGSDVGGGAVRVLDFPKSGSFGRPVFVVNSTFGGAGELGNSCANGGALSSIGASWTILNSVFSGNRATGRGANDGNGGNGGAIYNDGNTIHLEMCGTRMEDNHANEGGSAIFFVSNDRSGTIAITDSVLRNNPKGTFETAGFPGLFVQAKAPPTVTRSTIE